MDSYKPYVAVVVIQALYTGMQLISKVALNVGLKSYILVFYRQAIATIFLAPIALFLEWKTAPSLTFMAFFKIFMLSLFGITLSWNLNTLALQYTSATLASAAVSTIPVFTFILAVILRMEKLNKRTVPGIIKIIGIVICLGGALTIAFFNGPPYLRLLMNDHIFKNHSQKQDRGQNATTSTTTWIKGVVLMLISYLFWSSWLLFQGSMIKSFPSRLLCTTFQSFFSAIQCFIIAISLERNPNEWKLGWNIKLISVAYCGIVISGLTFHLQAWVVDNKGPVFQAIWTPLGLISTVCSAAVLFGLIISLGSILGAVLMVVGLYCVLWGKIKEQTEDKLGFELTDDKKGIDSASNDDVKLSSV
ncbi:OLC1v1008830C2 [Oldenlandia corymbosa var. corymbosa]|uniref:WAT1-related protein n=1 Tax=Oldenlandia corymbosa var. corymbosa TaxID=529605 RepID=A0AAV1DMH2_OLDCO|nr:OLC1v1008830C2 [Oldenlandia corymbosa var. corymbosa]